MGTDRRASLREWQADSQTWGSYSLGFTFTTSGQAWEMHNRTESTLRSVECPRGPGKGKAGKRSREAFTAAAIMEGKYDSISYHIKAIVFLRSSIIQYLVHLSSHSSHISILSLPSTIDDLHARMQAINNSAVVRHPRPSICISAAVCTSSHHRHPCQNLIIARPLKISQGRCHRETCMRAGGGLSWGSSI